MTPDLLSPEYFTCTRFSLKLLKTTCVKMQEAKVKHWSGDGKFKGISKNPQCQVCEQGAEVYRELTGKPKPITWGRVCRRCGTRKTKDKFPTPYATICSLCHNKTRRRDNGYHRRGEDVPTTDLIPILQGLLEDMSQRAAARRLKIHHATLNRVIHGIQKYVRADIAGKIRGAN